MFQKISNVVNEILTNKTKEERYFDEKYNNFFAVEDYLFCYTMIDEGYPINKKDKKRLNNIIGEKLEKNEYKYFQIREIKSLELSVKLKGLIKTLASIEYETIEMLLEPTNSMKNSEFFIEEIKGNKTDVLKFTFEKIKEYKKYYHSGLDSFNDFCRINGEQLSSKKQFLRKIMAANIILIKSGLLNNEEIIQIKDQFQLLSEYIENKTGSLFKSGSYERIGKSTIDEFVKALFMYSQKNNNNMNVKEDIIRQLKSYSVRKKTIDEEIKELMIKEDYSLEKLPKEIKQQIERITIVVNKINDQEVQQFFDERLPIILKKYFSIDEEYRTSLKNIEGYNAQELMRQSLENIERIIIAKKEDNNIDLMTDLSIENRKLKLKI